MINTPGVVIRFPPMDGAEKITAEFVVSRTLKLGDIAFRFENNVFRISVSDRVILETVLAVGQQLAKSLLEVASLHEEEMSKSQETVLRATEALMRDGNDVVTSDSVVDLARDHNIDLRPHRACVDEVDDGTYGDVCTSCRFRSWAS